MLAAIHLNNYAKLSTHAHIEINIKYIKIKWERDLISLKLNRVGIA